MDAARASVVGRCTIRPQGTVPTAQILATRCTRTDSFAKAVGQRSEVVTLRKTPRSGYFRGKDSAGSQCQAFQVCAVVQCAHSHGIAIEFEGCDSAVVNGERPGVPRRRL